MAAKSKIQRGFNFLSPFYDLLTRIFFGKALLRSQTVFLDDIGRFQNGLVFGGGTGSLLAELLKKDTGMNYCYLDISDRMIAKARKRTPHSGGKVLFICGTYTDLPPGISFDLIITPYVLDCFGKEQLPVVMDALSASLAPNGKWLFADFHIPAKGMMHYLSRIIIRILYFFFNIITGLGVKELPAFEKQFERLGFKKEKELFFRKGLLRASIYSRQ